MTDHDPKRQEYLEKLSFEYVRMAHIEWLESFKGVREFSSQAIRMLYILNGGALIALLALIGNMFGKVGPDKVELFTVFLSAIIPSFIPFVIGLISAGLVSAMAYINFSALDESSPNAAQLYGWLQNEAHELTNFQRNLPVITARIGLSFGFLSLVAFGAGCVLVYRSFEFLSG